MTPKSKHQRQTLRAEGRASQVSRDPQRSKSRRKAKGKAAGKGIPTHAMALVDRFYAFVEDHSQRSMECAYLIDRSGVVVRTS